MNGRTVTGLRLVDHSRESMLQTSAHFLNNYVCRYLCVIVLHVTVNVVNVYCYCCGVCMYMLHVPLCLCVLVSCGQRVYLAMRDYVCVLFLCINMLECVFLWYMSGIGICVVYVGGCMDPHGHGAKGTLPGTSCPMVSEGLLFHWWSCTKK